MKLSKPILILSITVTFLVTVFLYLWQIPLYQAKLRMISSSMGDRYYGRLSLWYIYARAGDWVGASKIAQNLDPSDIVQFSRQHQPEELKKVINQYVFKSNKTVDDWVELARIQAILGYTADAAKSIEKAHQMDPIRDDVSAIYYQLNN